MSKFQVILTSIFGVGIVAAVMFFSFSRGGGGAQSANVTIWGDLPSFAMQTLFSNTSVNQDSKLTLDYEEHATDKIASDLTEALASGGGPDLVIMPLDDLYKQQNKLLSIPYKNVSERDFTSTFIEEGELYFNSAGTYALPITIDPMVLYYNRDILSTKNVAQPIGYWDELFSASLNLTDKDAAGNIKTSALALGEAKNIDHAKDILSLLILQAGSGITGLSNGEFRSLLNYDYGQPTIPAESALEYYTQFSNPSKPYYSWNRSLPAAQLNFLSGDSAYYLGYASELKLLRNKNPNLNFGVTLVPQSRVSGKKITLGSMRGISITRNTQNAGAALAAALKLISQESLIELSNITALPPVRRDLLSQPPGDAVMSVFYEAALQSKGWVDPDPATTKNIFTEMIESVTSGRTRTSEALRKASTDIDTLLK